MNCWSVVLLTCAYEIGDTSIYFIHASNLTKNLSNIIKMCSFYFKIVVFYEAGIFIKKYRFFFIENRLDFIKKLPIVIYKKLNAPNSDL